VQPARADPVGAFLVLLNLLEGDAEQLAQALLAHADQGSPHADALSDVLVDGAR
jgi:hypothetical protein